MERLRRSFRNSFRRKKTNFQLESSKPHQWEADEVAVRHGNCTFAVKYLGFVQVEESRGMQICEQALLTLKAQKRKALRGLLSVSGDGLRVIDDETKGLIVDQTIEKVSFCAPDRNHDRGFSYICRDGTTKRWLCHGFLACKDSGERLSHAVGCAFAVCLERKQKRDNKLNENKTSSSINNVSSSSITSSVSKATNSEDNAKSFQRTGSFRRVPMLQRIKDPQECKTIEPLPVKPVVNPYAIERPHATAQLLERQGSLRIFNGLNENSPFKRQLSLRVTSSSALERQRRNTLHSARNVFDKQINLENTDQFINQNDCDLSAMCKEITEGLSALSSSNNSKQNHLDNLLIQDHNNVHSAPKNNGLSPTNCSVILDLNTSLKKKTNGTLRFGQLASYADDHLEQKNSNQNLDIFSTLTDDYKKMPILPEHINHNQHYLDQTLEKSSKSKNYFETDFDAPERTNITINLNSKNNNLLKDKDLFDPFDAEWASLSAKRSNEANKSTNPFLSSAVKAFELKM